MLSLHDDLYFLKGDGEMGTLMRAFDWAQTPVGTPGQWPLSLRSTVGLLLHSRFPMFLFWGNELTCFYNDAYRPSLGNNGKHPTAIGKPGIEVFPEIWANIQPLIDNVLAGAEAVMNHDLLLPIYRNGAMENVYWTFCYSPAFDDEGHISGVLVVCQETTEKVESLQKITEHASNITGIIEQSPIAIGLLHGKDMVINTVNQPILDAWGKGRSILGLPIIEALPELKGQPFLQLLDDVYTTGNPHYSYSMPATLIKNGKPELVYSDFVYAAMKNAAGSITGVMILANVVTEQVKSRRALEASEARFRSLIKAAPIAIALFIGRDLIIEEPNEAFVAMLAKGKGITGVPLRVAMPELATEGQPFLKILDDVFTTGKGYETTGTLVKVLREGKLTDGYFDFSYTPLYNYEQEVYAILELATDVTPQILSRQALQESEQKLRSMILQAPVAMCILREPDYKVDIANEKMFALWGTTASQVLGKAIFTGLPEAAGQGLEEVLLHVYTTGQAYHGYEVPIKLPRNGSVETAYVNFVYEAFKEADGSISGIMVVGTDVTEQVLAREQTERNAQQLQKLTDRLQLAIEAGELGLYEVNLETDALIASPRFNEIFELKEGSTRNDFLQVIHADDRTIRNTAYEAAIETGRLDYICRLTHKHANITWVRVRGKLSFNAAGKAVKLMGIVQDITDTKELEYQKDNFLGIASHELKTPVTTIKAYAQVMEATFKKSGDARHADMMGRIDKQVNKLQYLIADLLDVTKINSGRLQFNNTSFNFDLLAQEVAQELQDITPGHTIQTELKYGGEVFADRDRITQVITNLINNAVKYSPATKHIKVYSAGNDGMVTLCVEDFGIGIDEEKKEKVFEQFYRVSGSKEHTFPGLGLGLYISSEIIKRMNGRIWVNSTPGNGSTFCFSLPVKGNTT